MKVLFFNHRCRDRSLWVTPAEISFRKQMLGLYLRAISIAAFETILSIKDKQFHQDNKQSM